MTKARNGARRCECGNMAQPGRGVCADCRYTHDKLLRQSIRMREELPWYLKPDNMEWKVRQYSKVEIEARKMRRKSEYIW